MIGPESIPKRLPDQLKARAAGMFPGACLLVGGLLATGCADAETQVQTGSTAHWAPVIIQHQGGGLVESYPVPFGDDGSGEFTVYSWQDAGPDRRWYGYFWQYISGAALAVVVEVERGDGEPQRPTGVLLASRNDCRWERADSLRLVRDSVGLHPVVSVKDQRPGLGLGDLEPVLADSGVIDWTDLPRQGRQFPRNWRRQTHLAPGTPASFGVVLRHEPEGGFRLGSRRGQGNQPHHWNLLAYSLESLAADGSPLQDHSSEPGEWPCAGVFSDPGGTVERFQSRHEER